MPPVILHHLLNVFVQLAIKRGFTKKTLVMEKIEHIVIILLHNSVGCSEYTSILLRPVTIIKKREVFGLDTCNS
jgi:hypothetical protein